LAMWRNTCQAMERREQDYKRTGNTVMFAPFCLTALAGALLSSQGNSSTTGYLLAMPYAHAKAVAQRSIPYTPREGDLIFYDDHNIFLEVLFAWAGTGPPTHMGIVVKKPDGSLAVLEAGPDDTVWVKLIDLTSRLHQFHGDIVVRRCKVALSKDKSAALTCFAQAQNGKRYAVLRFLLQATPFRPRGLLAPFLACTYLNRDSWICSELAIAAGTVVDLFDRRVVRANATYPSDLVDNRMYDLSAHWHEPMEWKPRGLGKKARKSGKQPAR
jgi:hypothetical protein